MISFWEGWISYLNLFYKNVKYGKRERAEMANNRRNKHMYCKTQSMLDVKMVSRKDVDNGLVQDRSRPMIIVGSDVVGLYPNLRSKECGEEIC